MSSIQRVCWESSFSLDRQTKLSLLHYWPPPPTWIHQAMQIGTKNGKQIMKNIKHIDIEVPDLASRIMLVCFSAAGSPILV
jgi:hypothetical protein